MQLKKSKERKRTVKPTTLSASGKRLRILHNMTGLSDEQFSQVIGITRQTLRRWEQTNTSLPIAVREKFTNMGANPAWVEYGVDNPWVAECTPEALVDNFEFEAANVR